MAEGFSIPVERIKLLAQRNIATFTPKEANAVRVRKTAGVKGISGEYTARQEVREALALAVFKPSLKHGETPAGSEYLATWHAAMNERLLEKGDVVEWQDLVFRVDDLQHAQTNGEILFYRALFEVIQRGADDAVIPDNNPPEFVESPTLTGNAKLGESVTLSLGVHSGDAPINAAHLFFRDDVPQDEESQVYTFAPEDVATNIRALVMIGNAYGITFDYSNTVGPVEGNLQPPENTIAPVLSGDLVVGGSVAVDVGAHENEPTEFAIVIKVDGQVEHSGVALSYDVTPAMIYGLSVTAEVTASNAAGSVTTATNALQSDYAVLLNKYPFPDSVAIFVSTLNADADEDGEQASTWRDLTGAFEWSQDVSTKQPYFEPELYTGTYPSLEFVTDDAMESTSLAPMLHSGVFGMGVVTTDSRLVSARAVIGASSDDGTQRMGFLERSRVYGIGLSQEIITHPLGRGDVAWIVATETATLGYGNDGDLQETNPLVIGTDSEISKLALGAAYDDTGALTSYTEQGFCFVMVCKGAPSVEALEDTYQFILDEGIL